MHIIVYHNNHPIILCDAIDKNIASYYKHEHTLCIKDISTKSIEHMLHSSKQKRFYAGIFLYPHFDILKREYWNFFDLILAGGGVVFNDLHELLLMYRRGFWDLPKGKLENDETIEACAVREVKEETGLTNMILQEKIITTYHTYQEKGKYILKETHWFKMLVNGKPNVKPQIEEQIEIVKWVSQNDVKKYITQMYSSIVDVVNHCL